MRSILADDDSSREMTGEFLGRIAAVTALVAEQAAILDGLRNLFVRALPGLNHSSVHSIKDNESMLHIPVLSDPAKRAKGQMSYTVAALEKIIEDRRQFSKTLQKTQATVSIRRLTE